MEACHVVPMRSDAAPGCDSFSPAFCFSDVVVVVVAPSIGKVEAAVRGLQGGKEDMVASLRGELFPCRKINL